MKTILFSLSALILSLTSAQACQVSESQIIGTIVSAKGPDNACALEVRLTRAQPHAFCPLNVSAGQVVAFEIDYSNVACASRVGTEISGVLQSSGNGYRLDW